ncbi:MAG TPA: hypothetical protein VLL97_04485, partial [Acidobacteriota bacterium]|nr:hypothetical protein [Acidobacteriota bacterium]
KRKEEAVFRAGLKTGAMRKMTGAITEIKCGYGSTIDMQVESDGRNYRLFAERLQDVAYWGLEAPGTKKFDPCRDLRGKLVEIDYLAVESDALAGFIREIFIIK